MLKLRPHHLNCIPRFCGSGYSEEFCKNMQNIRNRLLGGENYEIVNDADDICCCCPNLINGVCKDHEKVLRFDRQTLLLGTNDISQICSDCEWYSICKKN